MRRILISLLITLCILPFLTQAQLYFTENKGQWDKQVLFKTDAGNSAFFLGKEGYTILMQQPEDYIRSAEYYHGHSFDSSRSNVQFRSATPPQMRAHAYRVKFLGADFNTQIIKEKPLPGYENYFIGNDQTKWAGDCRQFQAITYKNIYPGVDLRYYVQDDRLKYDLIISPGADVSKIKMMYEGASSLSIKNSELVIGTSVGDAKELKPYTFQYKNGGREFVNCRYKLEGNTVGFDVRGYDKTKILVIDPTLVFSSYSRSDADNWGFSATPGPDGSMYGAGIALRTGFPVTPGVIGPTGGGGSINTGVPPDIVIMRLTPNGSARIYATYLGGNDLEQPHSLIADAQGNLVIAGRTSSGNFPVTAPNPGTGGSYDIFVTKINAAGSSIIGSIKIGGTGDDGVNISPDRFNGGARSILRNYGDDGRSEVILDRNNNILVASCTQSTNFPIQGGFQTTNRGNQDGVVIKLNPNCNALIWSTYLGGSGNDAAFVLTENPVTSDIYVGGGTTSSDMLLRGGVQPAYNGGLTDGFVSNLRDIGTSVALVRTTYMGTSGTDIVYGVKFDKNGFPYVMGTTSGSWPIVRPINSTSFYSVPNSSQFIAKLQPDLSAFVYSTAFGTLSGGDPNLSPVAFLVDNCENVYVSGWGGDLNRRLNYPNAGTTGLPVTPDAFQASTDGSDFYFFVLQKNAQSQLYGSFFGQAGGLGEHVDGGTSRFDETGTIYQAICACLGNTPISRPFPITAGVYGNINASNSGARCNLAMVKLRFDLSGIDVSLKTVGARQLNFCRPATIEFFDSVRLAKNYIWIWGDGTKNDTTAQNPRLHIYNGIGFYDVKVIGIDSNSCNIKDSATIRIRVTTDSVDVKFDFARRGCNSLTFDFTNTSDRLTSIPTFTSKSFAWVWGDGTKSDTIPAFAPNPLSHTFPSPGTYNVRLVLIDTNFCNSGEEAAIVNFSVIDNVRAGFRVDNLCVPDTVNIVDTSLGALTYLWVSSDGQTSTDPIPAFVYTTPGTYTITQTVFNPNTCNLQATTSRTFTASAKPVPGFNYNPNPSRENTPTSFISTASPDVIRWQWNFGDGATSTLRNPIHQYIRPNPANIVCQTVFNAAGCQDSICIPVESIINILNDLPTAFTPNGDGVNDVFLVRGFGITKMTLRVFNRQGLMVFETQTQSIGWDGTYKGIPQPMDAYAWTLDVEYFTGDKLKKKGDVTLIR
ncbi:MAG: gliding motility-associated C-terminal domain-containing protein [Chitinophagaceae bacterium]|nr:gliding motility-associated C-terminal domain-containing protein [Chitinophagaceae bacterium]